ncbi:G-protein coupled receptor family C group 6 member A-like isoform X1 [Salmo trutta]|uniref:G-protein coupled receptor family C group 6 member A-like isoform X1 n=1 Tax=Salmo trutta TaxID=8032 RepID=UPI001131BD1E|nr:G-protein coupled receptor family C group 6 member A-like isoform X1 [Salmo trutta]XP_029593728.1 G-protein coupled receptor family C group 6 member A-like isoform X1 [Salmo trutta]
MDLLEIGHVVGFSFKRGNLAPFHHYLMNLSDINDVIGNNSFLKEFYSLPNGSGDPKVLSSFTVPAEILLNNSHADVVFSVEMAVSAIVHAVADICSKKDCKTPGTVQPWQVLGALKDSCFELEGKSYCFDKKGDINLGYDVTLWRSVRGVINVHDVVAEYHPINNSFSYTSGHIKNLTDLRVRVRVKVRVRIRVRIRVRVKVRSQSLLVYFLGSHTKTEFKVHIHINLLTPPDIQRHKHKQGRMSNNLLLPQSD